MTTNTPIHNQPTGVTTGNFARVETHAYMARFVEAGGFGRFIHGRELTQIDAQDVVRMNRDTLYSSAVFDVGESPAVITLPDAGGRYMAIQIIDEDHYTRLVAHDPGPYTLDQAVTGTRYTAVLVRLFVDPLDPADVAAANALQDAIRVEQERPGSFTVPAWDTTSLDRVRDALKQLGRAQGGFRHRRDVWPPGRGRARWPPHWHRRRLGRQPSARGNVTRP